MLAVCHGFVLSLLSTLRCFVSEVRNKYRDNSFHNFYHAFSVMQASLLLLVQVCAGVSGSNGNALCSRYCYNSSKTLLLVFTAPTIAILELEIASGSIIAHLC